MKEEQLKQTLEQVLIQFNQQGLTIGTEFYILKNVFNDFEKMYDKHLSQEIQKQKEEQEPQEIKATPLEEPNPVVIEGNHKEEVVE